MSKLSISFEEMEKWVSDHPEVFGAFTSNVKVVSINLLVDDPGKFEKYYRAKGHKIAKFEGRVIVAYDGVMTRHNSMVLGYLDDVIHLVVQGKPFPANLKEFSKQRQVSLGDFFQGKEKSAPEISKEKSAPEISKEKSAPEILAPFDKFVKAKQEYFGTLMNRDVTYEFFDQEGRESLTLVESSLLELEAIDIIKIYQILFTGQEITNDLLYRIASLISDCRSTSEEESGEINILEYKENELKTELSKIKLFEFLGEDFVLQDALYVEKESPTQDNRTDYELLTYLAQVGKLRGKKKGL